MEQKNKAENGKKEIYQTKLFWIGLVLAGLAAGFLVGLFLLKKNPDPLWPSARKLTFPPPAVTIKVKR